MPCLVLMILDSLQLQLQVAVLVPCLVLMIIYSYTFLFSVSALLGTNDNLQLHVPVFCQFFAWHFIVSSCWCFLSVFCSICGPERPREHVSVSEEWVIQLHCRAEDFLCLTESRKLHFWCLRGPPQSEGAGLWPEEQQLQSWSVRLATLVLLFVSSYT